MCEMPLGLKICEQRQHCNTRRTRGWHHTYASAFFCVLFLLYSGSSPPLVFFFCLSFFFFFPPFSPLLRFHQNMMRIYVVLSRFAFGNPLPRSRSRAAVNVRPTSTMPPLCMARVILQASTERGMSSPLLDLFNIHCVSFSPQRRFASKRVVLW